MLDALSSPEELVDRAIDLGINMLGLSDHESLSGHIRLNKYAQQVKEQHPDFKIAYGNEIYLTKTRDKGQKYFHFLLCSRDAIGHHLLREQSSMAWINGYYDRGLQRVPILYSEMEDLIKKYGKGHIIASSACIGSAVGQNLLALKNAEEIGDNKARKQAHDNIVQHILWCKEWFGDDFYLEIAPAEYSDQVYVNKMTLKLADVFDLKVTVQDDAHRLTQEDYIAHKALLNSKITPREDIDSFYRYTYLQSYDDIRKHLAPTGCDVDQLFANSMEMYDKVEEYSLLHSQQVPQVPVPNFPKKKVDSKYKNLNRLYDSDNDQERYWVNYCVDKLKEKNIYNDKYLTELDEEARVQTVVGQHLDTCIFSYPIFLKHYFDLIWECGSVVGCGRGSSSAGLDNYLMNLTQYDPIKNNVNNYFRYLNDFRYELPDLDFDLAPSVRPIWFDKIREERGKLGLVQVCTFSTMSAKASILAACRGYRSKKYPDGIDNDEAQYLASLVGSKRGFTYSIKDMVEGNAEKDLQPNTLFINEVNKYDGLLDIIKKLEGTISARSQHASGIIFNDRGHEFDNGAIMTATDGTLITQWSLHDAEAAGKVKIDSLVTDIEEKITRCLLLLQKYGHIEKDLTLRQIYDKYIHPDVLPLNDKEIWDNIDAGNIHNLFQFDTAVGGQGIKKLQPKNIDQLSAINALIRLMAQEPGAETPLDRYARIKAHPEQWDAEMDSYGLTKNEQSIIKEYCAHSYGTLPLQDDLMLMMMDDRLFDFDLKAANSARKIIGKKLMDKIPQLHRDILSHAKNEKVGKYVYDVLFSEQLGYSFNKEHCKSYSMIGFQCAFLAVKFQRIFWDCACLQVDSGLEIDANTNYAKIAKAMGKMSNQGIKFSLLDINRSEYYFEPDEKNNQILYGFKALNGTNGETIQEIIENRPYNSFEDYLAKTNINRTVTINLIKSGAFDQFGTPQEIMEKYLRSISNPKKRLTLQNFNGLIEANLIPKELKLQKQVFNFNRMIKKACKYDVEYFALDKNDIYRKFYEKYFDTSLLETRNNHILVSKKNLKKQYDDIMKVAKDYLAKHQEEMLKKYNDSLFQELWDKYAQGNVSHWEMESLGMYYHEHELAHVSEYLYGVRHFKDLPTKPIVEYTFKKGNKEFPIYGTTRIIGTVIAKDDVRSSISLLTKESGVVTCKMTRDYYAMYNRQISEIDAKGEKHVMDRSWFTKGTLLLVNGYRRQDTFKLKGKRSKGKVISHQLYKITKIYPDGRMAMTNARYGQDNEE